MKSPKRPPLKLTDDEAVAPVDLSTSDEMPVEEATHSLDPIPEPDFEIVQPTFEPPMSERRRRRLLEEQRQAEERALTAERGAAPVNAKPTPEAPVDMAVTAGQPPAPFELSKPPAVKTVQAKAQGEPSGRHAYVIAGVASALWIGGVASWAAYEFGAGGQNWIRCESPSTP
jgi:hypothetical protein